MNKKVLLASDNTTWMLKFLMKRIYGEWTILKMTPYICLSSDIVSFNRCSGCGRKAQIFMKRTKSYARRWWLVTTWSWLYFLFCVLLLWSIVWWIWKKEFIQLATLRTKELDKSTARSHITSTSQNTSSF